MTEVSCFQDSPRLSLELIERAQLNPRDSAVVDVGGGASRLVDQLFARGFAHVSVLDIAEAALSKAKSRLGDDKAA